MTDIDRTDLLHGVAAVSGYLGMTRAQIYHLHRAGKIPTFKIDKIVCARKATLEAWLADKEAQAKVEGKADV